MLWRENRKEWVITAPGKDSPNGSKNRECVEWNHIGIHPRLCKHLHFDECTALSKHVAWRWTVKHTVGPEIIHNLFNFSPFLSHFFLISK